MEMNVWGMPGKVWNILNYAGQQTVADKWGGKAELSKKWRGVGSKIRVFALQKLILNKKRGAIAPQALRSLRPCHRFLHFTVP